MYYANMTKDQLVLEVERLHQRVASMEASENALKHADEARKALENQLLQAQKMEAIGQLAGGIAHDFNNLLSVIINYAYLLKPHLKHNNKSSDMIDQILSLSGRGSDIIQGLLAFSKKHIINPVPLNLNDSVTSMEKLLRKYLDEDIEINIRLSPRPPVVMADSSQIEQIIMNLATNARDAMPEGGTLTIETGFAGPDVEFMSGGGAAEPDAYALLTVADTGNGMDGKTSQKIFEPFFTTKETGQGTGLGLAIVYGIVKQHCGHIRVHSVPQKGTTFEIYFRTEDTGIEKKKAENPSLLRGKSEAVLVAEDEFSVRQSAKNILEEYGYKVIEAVDGEDAVKKFLKHRDEVKILLMDVVMPRKNGQDAFEEIKKINPELKVIFTSGYSHETIRRKGVLKDNFHYVVKPVLPDVLLKKIREVLNEAGDPQQSSVGR